jgi:hypothetical protein
MMAMKNNSGFDSLLHSVITRPPNQPRHYLGEIRARQAQFGHSVESDSQAPLEARFQDRAFWPR